MNDLIGTIFSAWTVVVCVLFAGISWWVYGSARKAGYETAARIPLEDDDAPIEVKDHG